mgnify:CR=1 FL=1
MIPKTKPPPTIATTGNCFPLSSCFSLATCVLFFDFDVTLAEDEDLLFATLVLATSASFCVVELGTDSLALLTATDELLCCELVACWLEVDAGVLEELAAGAGTLEASNTKPTM